MNFDDIEADIKSLEKTAKGFTVESTEDYENAKKFSQSVSSITLWLNKLLASLADCNKQISGKMSAYERKPQPSQNVCVACNGTGKASNGNSCKPCNGTGHKVMPVQPKKEGLPTTGTPEPAKAPSIPASAPKVEPAPSLDLDDFDLEPMSEEDQLAVELQKTLF